MYSPYVDLRRNDRPQRNGALGRFSSIQFHIIGNREWVYRLNFSRVQVVQVDAQVAYDLHKYNFKGGIAIIERCQCFLSEPDAVQRLLAPLREALKSEYDAYNRKKIRKGQNLTSVDAPLD